MTIPMVNEFIYLTKVLAAPINQPLYAGHPLPRWPCPHPRPAATPAGRGNLSI